MPIVGANRSPRFQRGGALADQRAMYIEREADGALLAALEVGDYCLVFAPRQVGKSSLRVRAAEALRERGVNTAFVDLSAVGAEARAEDWYFSVTREIAASLGLAGEVSGFWDMLGERETPALQLRRFMAEVVLERVSGPVVVFVDETDVTLSLPFSRDDFFAAIRAMFNLRAEDEQWQRLSFCLFGVMTRDDLVEDWERTPFNIECTEIRLRDFSRREMEGFVPGLQAVEDQWGPAVVEAVLDAVHGWTAGHPALSQRLLAAVVDAGVEEGREQALVDELVAELFLERGRELDPVLGDTARRFGRDRSGDLLPRMLEIYERLLRGERVAANGRALGANGMQLLSRLRVAGLVGETEDGNLEVRSRIVAQVFDLEWTHSVATERLL
ncbi:MAG: AAA-like domain-containing protein, partial [Myxococcales bacterium]|nr:AAA-like domain-containing protein [Myxococcales bacterium]